MGPGGWNSGLRMEDRGQRAKREQEAGGVGADAAGTEQR